MKNSIVPSVFGADLGHLKDQLDVLEANGIEWLHVDVMDGHFVEKMAFGPDHVHMLKQMTSLKLDVHLMVEKPERILDAILVAGADRITIHQEATNRLNSCLEHIHAKHKEAGVVLCPATNETTLKYVLDHVDMILLMTINPGESNQSFHPDIVEKIKRTREMCGLRSIDIEVDGGIDNTNIALCKKAGANVFVSGGYVFHGDIAQNLMTLNEELR